MIVACSVNKDQCNLVKIVCENLKIETGLYRPDAKYVVYYVESTYVSLNFLYNSMGYKEISFVKMLELLHTGKYDTPIHPREMQQNQFGTLIDCHLKGEVVRIGDYLYTKWEDQISELREDIRVKV